MSNHRRAQQGFYCAVPLVIFALGAAMLASWQMQRVIQKKLDVMEAKRNVLLGHQTGYRAIAQRLTAIGAWTYNSSTGAFYAGGVPVLVSISGANGGPRILSVPANHSTSAINSRVLIGGTYRTATFVGADSETCRQIGNPTAATTYSVTYNYSYYGNDVTPSPAISSVPSSGMFCLQYVINNTVSGGGIIYVN